MRRTIAIVTLALIALGLWLSKPYVFLPSGASIVGWWYADSLAECAHEPAVGRTGYWLPTAQQITDLDLAMSNVMFERERAGLKVPPPGQRFDGQYIGITRNGKRYIYGHFFPSYMRHEDRWSADWTPFDQPVCVADGGRHFWGIVYDPDKNEVEQPRFNGEA